MSKVIVISLNTRYKNLEKSIKKAVRKLFLLTNQKNVYLEIYLVGDSFMDKNVLAFPVPRFFYRPDIQQKNLGEIYLNPDYIRNEKLEIRNEKLGFDKKLLFMIIHGFLHLLGYDHKKKGDTINMQKKEKILLKKLKVF